MREESATSALIGRRNIGINDVCGDFSLTLIDNLDTLAVYLACLLLLRIGSRGFRRIRASDWVGH